MTSKKNPKKQNYDKVFCLYVTLFSSYFYYFIKMCFIF